MSRWTLSPRDRRAVRFGAAVTVSVAAWSLAVAPYWRHAHEMRGELARERAILARERGVRAAERELRAAARTSEGRMADALPLLFDPGTGGLVSAAVGDYVTVQAAAAGVRLEALEEHPRSGARVGLQAVALAVTGRGTLHGLHTLLARLGSGSKLVQVDSLTVDHAPPDGTSAQAARAPLAFRFTVTGFALVSAVETPAVPPSTRGTSALAQGTEGP